MTSKEAIEHLRNHTQYYKPVNREAFRTIEKDLEILDILKRLFNEGVIQLYKEDFEGYRPIYKIEDYDAYKDIIISEEDFNLIEEWLNNDSK